jgi:hypothetical protein
VRAPSLSFSSSLSTLACVALIAACAGADGASSGADGGDIVESADAGGTRADGGGATGHDSGGATDGGATSGDGGSVAVDSGSGGGTDSGVGPKDAGGAIDSGGGGNGPITCPGPGSPKNNGGACGSERWNIKTGTDSMAAGVSLVPKNSTIAQLVALAAAGGGTSRETPTETTLWELTNVTLSMIKLETDSDYHIVLSDGSHTMIAEIPYPSCATGSAWSCFMSRARSEVDAKLNVSTSPQYPSLTVTVRGVGFFDFSHGQIGVAPNAIELHPILQICFGQGCTPT